jgi:mono/diheme cytochrome c family protein
VTESSTRFAGHALLALGLLGPIDKEIPPYAPMSDQPSIARGRYLAWGPANCVGCHTRNSPLADFAFSAPAFSGGAPITSEIDPSVVHTPPNLTPALGTGVIADWSEDQFVQRLREGRIHPGSSMPWENYMLLSESDVRSLYRFLHSLEPV